MIRYTFASDKVLAIKNIDKVDPQKIGESIAEIAARNNGVADPHILWKEAKNPAHPAHLCYEWDVQKAAEAHWTSTSRKLITSIRPLDVKGEEMEIPAFISVNTGGGTGYRTHSDVLDSAELRNRVLEQAERDLIAFQQRYRRFAELFKALEAPIQAVRKLRGRRKDDRPNV